MTKKGMNLSYIDKTCAKNVSFIFCLLFSAKVHSVAGAQQTHVTTRLPFQRKGCHSGLASKPIKLRFGKQGPLHIDEGCFRETRFYELRRE